MMSLELRRVILFTANLAEMTAFYRDVVGLEVAGREDGWVDFYAGACGLALHAGPSKVGARPPKIVFHTADVAGARAALVKRGLAHAGPVKSTSSFDMCDCKDPDGNAFQLSSRA
jgi:catechol 2,3-dioxygenase-like lactoylglutathione lyase family enzyme